MATTKPNLERMALTPEEIAGVIDVTDQLLRKHPKAIAALIEQNEQTRRDLQELGWP